MYNYIQTTNIILWYNTIYVYTVLFYPDIVTRVVFGRSREGEICRDHSEKVDDLLCILKFHEKQKSYLYFSMSIK